MVLILFLTAKTIHDLTFLNNAQKVVTVSAINLSILVFLEKCLVNLF